MLGKRISRRHFFGSMAGAVAGAAAIGKRADGQVTVPPVKSGHEKKEMLVDQLGGGGAELPIQYDGNTYQLTSHEEIAELANGPGEGSISACSDGAFLYAAASYDGEANGYGADSWPACAWL